MKELRLEWALTGLIALAILVLFGLQVSSLFVAPIHDSYLWWGDESWLMSEYRSQVTTGVFRHSSAYGSSLWIGNPFPFTAMWLTSAIYGAGSLVLASLGNVDAGRVITAILVTILLIAFWRMGKWFRLSPLSVLSSVALLVSSRSFFLTSHSARYDIITALALMGMVGLLIKWQGVEFNGKNYFVLGVLFGAGLLVSIHVPLLLTLPSVYFLFTQRAKLKGILFLLLGVVISVGVLYLIHLGLQPRLIGETNLSENLRTIPMLRPFSWSVQSSNLVQKWALVVSFAPQILLMLLGCIEGLRCPDQSRNTKRSIVLLMLPILGWLLFQPAGPSSYLIHFLPCLALASAIGINSILVGTWQRGVVGAIALVALGFGTSDSIVAGQVGRELTEQHASALSTAKAALGEGLVIAMNPAQSFLGSTRLGTTHFVELPNREAKQLSGSGFLLTYNSSISPGFMWEVLPLREEIRSPELVRTGHFLDAGRSYFDSLDKREDTLFLQRLDLNALYRRHIH
jgi:hypothetical protein